MKTTPLDLKRHLEQQADKYQNAIDALCDQMGLLDEHDDPMKAEFLSEVIQHLGLLKDAVAYVVYHWDDYMAFRYG